jgi:cysteinyl-tRNA synthetase
MNKTNKKLELKLHNTLTKKDYIINNINDFKKIGMYVCGPTLYNELHIGNGRSLVVFDVFFRFFKHIFKEVIYVRNITDIEDKIIKKALEEDLKPDDIVNRYEVIFKKDLENLNILSPTFEPKATHFIKEMILYIQKLIENGFAYKTKSGNVYFNTQKLDHYDYFQNPNNLQENKKIDNKEDKNHWQDFALWKFVDDKFGYESPWGYGRPGWHLECSVMSEKYLGEEFLFHGGGEDLAFPHHHNEIAQSFGYCNKCISKIFVHNGLLQLNGEKMSKSLGNSIFIKEKVFNKYDGDILRYLYLSTYYSSNLNVNESIFIQSESNINKIREFKYKYMIYYKENQNENKEVYIDDLLKYMNIPETITYLFKLMNEIENIPINYNLIMNTWELLGFDLSIRSSLSINEINELIEERKIAKNNKNYILSDEIRKKLEKDFVKIEDQLSVSIWFYI